MDTIEDKLSRLAQTKSDIRNALLKTGIAVPADAKFSDYITKILEAPCYKFPDLQGDVIRWSFKGLTNEQMSKNPRLEDVDGKGRFLTFKNFAWGEMSGVGGYTQNYNNSAWRIALDRAETTKTGHSFNVTSVTSTVTAFYYQSGSGQEPFTVKSQIVRVSGLTDGQSIKYGTGVKSVLVIESDGIYTLPPFDFAAKGIWYGFSFGKIQESCNITLEQLPYYPGALVFDGVDDYGVCDNFPILTKEKGYTVVALRKWLTPENKTNNEVLVANLKEPRWITENWGAFGCEVKYNNVNPKVKRTMSFGNTPVINVNENNVLLCQTSNNYNGVDIVSGNNTSGPYLLICSGGTSFFAKAAIWEIVILDHDATEEELTKIKNYFIKTYPWLFFDQAWTVVGKSNEDTDRATIANITGNGNNLVLSNFGFAGNSGYGEYAYNWSNISEWNAYSNNATSELTSSTIHITEVKSARPFLERKSNTGGYNKMKIKVTDIKPGEILRFASDLDPNNAIIIETDGNYSLPGSSAEYYGFRLSNSANTYPFNCDITIEQIPDHEGYLVTDGVDDKIESPNFKLDKDFTIVGEWEFLNASAISAGISKENSLRVFDFGNRLVLYLNSTSERTAYYVRSLNAICSDGRIYNNNWTEYQHEGYQSVESSNSALKIGYLDTYFDKLAFKNFAIYPKVLFKDDCIKAYIYLQTLKAK